MAHSGGKWGVIIVLMGEFHHNIDDKNRLIIPAKFRNELGDNIVITRGLEKCLFVYSLDEWNKIIERINTLPFTKKNVRAFERSFIGGASMIDFDKQGRIVITSPLVHYANIQKECVIIGVNERLEIWDKESFDKFMEESSECLDEVTENLFEGGYEA